ncbi:MAG: anaerobic sulfatase maturase, partial [Chloroflexota bacterium]
MNLEEAPVAFHLLAKPTGAACNLACRYCFFLAKQELYPGSRFRMSGAVLEAYISQLLAAHQVPEVAIAWQGGEPTLMGLDFFRHSVALAKRYRQPGQQISHTIQTNGTLLDDEWCAFFKEHRFLVGLSLDGPRELHDVYRVDRGGKGTFDRVMAGLRLLQKHDVDCNLLVTVNRVNADYPLDVYRFLRDEAGAEWLQFIPIVERVNADGRTVLQEGSTVTARSVLPRQFGQFLSVIFEEWVHRDVGRVFVQMFEATLRKWGGLPSGMCIFKPTCGLGPALEHNGDLYSCDHFVQPSHRLGNILHTPMLELVTGERQRQFGQAKANNLPRYCRACEFHFACHGECPKNRFLITPDGEAGLNYLCEGYRAFYRHADP